MDKILEFELTSDDPAEINKLLDQYIEALDRIHREMVKDREEIDQINAENTAILAKLRNLMREAV
ncbi:MAG: hypothetical protein JMDDDDMK_04325 [Acidobacteria bacterium]|nr:hypothetical protein [Acidobacteriota bacterium]